MHIRYPVILEELGGKKIRLIEKTEEGMIILCAVMKEMSGAEIRYIKSLVDAANAAALKENL